MTVTWGPRAASGPLLIIFPSGFADGRGDFPQLHESGLHDSRADAGGGAGQLGDKPAHVGHHPLPTQRAQGTSCELKGEPATAVRGQSLVRYGQQMWGKQELSAQIQPQTQHLFEIGTSSAKG